jgi:hypothetical protein
MKAVRRKMENEETNKEMEKEEKCKDLGGYYDKEDQVCMIDMHDPVDLDN